MTPDVIVAWPQNCDYPIWRRFITENRHRFARILVAFTPHDGPDYRDFVRDALPFAECFDTSGGEWRDTAVNAALDRSDADWVWFTEQDFFVYSPSFWDTLRDDRPLDAVGWKDETPRWHPSSLLIRRETIERTTRYFGPEPVDHFYRFGRDLDAVGRPWSLEMPPFGLVAGTDWEHLQGLSQNHYLIDRGEDAGVFKRERFRRYLRECLAVTPLDPRWEANAQKELAEGI